ncbi:hypothetical protein MSAS_16860 [Mycobacterium saskatchewanense]|nr:hypothetical protein MSAS_16860 [Mycobacterium saskatchewanense]
MPAPWCQPHPPKRDLRRDLRGKAAVIGALHRRDRMKGVHVQRDPKVVELLKHGGIARVVEEIGARPSHNEDAAES